MVRPWTDAGDLIHRHILCTHAGARVETEHFPIYFQAPVCHNGPCLLDVFRFISRDVEDTFGSPVDSGEKRRHTADRRVSKTSAKGPR